MVVVIISSIRLILELNMQQGHSVSCAATAHVVGAKMGSLKPEPTEMKLQSNHPHSAFPIPRMQPVGKAPHSAVFACALYLLGCCSFWAFTHLIHFIRPHDTTSLLFLGQPVLLCLLLEKFTSTFVAKQHVEV